ncbi:MAG: hypothetical protein NUV76_12395 [Candidatus Kuenenia sp.]|nr:hypothetical protein [Candidatus Kuenenia sp.]
MRTYSEEKCPVCNHVNKVEFGDPDSEAVLRTTLRLLVREIEYCGECNHLEIKRNPNGYIGYLCTLSDCEVRGSSSLLAYPIPNWCKLERVVK